MKRVCAWCSKHMGNVGGHSSKSDISHGICTQCLIAITNDDGPRSAAEILNFVQEPVFLIDSEGIVKAANVSGLRLVEKEFEQIENKLGGDVFECSYASEEQGCGKTIHCKTCTIRNIVMDTLSTNQGYTNVPAFQSIETKDGQKVLRFHISTEKIEDRVLLRIDQVSHTE